MEATTKDFEFTVTCKNCKVTIKSKYPNVLPETLDFGDCHNCTPAELINAEHELNDKKIDLGREFDKDHADKKRAYVDSKMYQPICDYVDLYNRLKPAGYPVEPYPTEPQEAKEVQLNG